MVKARRKKMTPHDDVDHYSYSVAWSEADQTFVARVLEFPLLSADGSTPDAGLKEIRVVVGHAIELMLEDGTPIPEPLGRRKFSGRVLLRMGEGLHRRLSMEAERQGLSLNQLISQKLATG